MFLLGTKWTQEKLVEGEDVLLLGARRHWSFTEPSTPTSTRPTGKIYSGYAASLRRSRRALMPWGVACLIGIESPRRMPALRGVDKGVVPFLSGAVCDEAHCGMSHPNNVQNASEPVAS